MTRRRVGVLISGRGSNMAALLTAAATPAFPAEIVLVLANNQPAARVPRTPESRSKSVMAAASTSMPPKQRNEAVMVPTRAEARLNPRAPPPKPANRCACRISRWSGMAACMAWLLTDWSGVRCGGMAGTGERERGGAWAEADISPR